LVSLVNFSIGIPVASATSVEITRSRVPTGFLVEATEMVIIEITYTIDNINFNGTLPTLKQFKDNPPFFFI